MTTGAYHANFTSTRLVSTEDLRDRLQTRLNNDNVETRQRIWPTDGIFDGVIAFDTGLVDAFGLANDVQSTDGAGNILRHVLATDDGSNVPFENTNGVTYYVGLRSIRRPVGVQINPRTALPEYIRLMEDVGEQGDPDTVIDNGNDTITFNINTLAESGHDYSGRTAIVYMKTPQRDAVDESIAFETLVVAYAAPNNTITTTYNFGQRSVSVDPSDYEVVLLGPTVKRDLDLTTVDGIVHVGTVEGGGAGSQPAGADNSTQNNIDVNLSELNEILNEFTSARTIRNSRAGQRAATFTLRSAVAATLYAPTGEIYVMSGQRTTTQVSNLNDAYNPSTDTWTARAVVPVQSNAGLPIGARRRARAVELDGIIYLIGGNNFFNDFELVQRYNPQTNTWDTPAADLPAPRSGGSVAAINGMIYYAGGMSSNNTVRNDNTYCYDPLLDVWVEMDVVPVDTAYQAHAVATSADGDDRLYTFGGVVVAGNGSTDACYEYNAVLNQWTQRSNVPRGPGSIGLTLFNGDSKEFNSGGAATVNGVIHVIGGTYGTRSSSRKHLLYNPITDEYSHLDDISSPSTAGHACVADDVGTIYIGFGSISTLYQFWHGFNASLITSATRPGLASETGRLVERENTGVNDWSATLNGYPIADMPGRRWNAAFCKLGRVLYVMGGLDETSTATSTFWAYYVDTNSWENLAPYNTAVEGAALVADEASGLIWKVQGMAALVADAHVRYYNPETNTWSASQGTLANPGKDSTVTLVGNRIYIFGQDRGAGLIEDVCRYFDIANLGEVTITSLNAGDRCMMNREGIVVGSQIWYWGGNNGAGSVAGVQSYDIITDSHTVAAGPTIPVIEGSHGVLLVDPDTQQRYIWMGPGVEVGIGSRLVRLFDLSIGTSEPPDPMTEPERWGYVLAEFDGRLFIFGGATNTGKPPAGASILDDGVVTSLFAWPARTGKLENFSGYNFNRMNVSETWGAFTGINRRRARRVQRDTIAFNAGDMWGLGTWDGEVEVDVIRQGES